MSVDLVVAIAGALWTLISLIVSATPTHVDDELLTWVRRVLERVSFLQPSNSPGALSMPGLPAARPHPPYDRAAVEADADKDGTP